MTWRERSAPIIARVIAEYGDNERELEKALYRAYPWGERKYHPYKIWLSEIKRQMAKRKLPGATITGSLFEAERLAKQKSPEATITGSLFEDSK